MEKKCILIDGHSIMYRMFYGIREMNTSKGIPTNAIYGFVNILYRLKKQFSPQYFAVTFDMSNPTFRHELYSDYKAGREKMPEDLSIQCRLIKELLSKMNIRVVEKAGYEGDDLIGSIAGLCSHAGIETFIVTGDKDTFQLVNEQVKIAYTSTRTTEQFTIVDSDYISDRYGVSPQALLEVKALMGDPSDNIPGVAGIGEKTALKLISQYHTIDCLYENINDLKGKQKEKLEIGKNNAYLSRCLGRIRTDVPLEFELNDISFSEMINDDVIALLKDWEFDSVLNRISAEQQIELSTNNELLENIPFSVVEDSKTIYYLLSAINQIQKVIMHGMIIEKKYFLSVLIDGHYYLLKDYNLIRHLITGLSELPDVDSIQVIGHDLKYLTHYFNEFNVCIPNYTFDTMIGGYLLNPSNNHYELSDLSLKYLNKYFPDHDTFWGKGKAKKTLSEIDPFVFYQYLINQCSLIEQLFTILKEQLSEKNMDVLNDDIELPLLQVMAEMETQGFRIDLIALQNLSKSFEEQLNDLTDEIFKLAGHEFNINSPKQLGVVLFEELKLPVIKKTKSGYSTGADILEELRLFHPIVDKLLSYRALAKLDGTYGKGLLKLIDTNTSKIHSTFNQTVTATGRISSSDPNLQNIPVRSEIGRKIRKVFIPSSSGRVLVDADYSQIELRVLAHLSEDENLIDAFIKGQDVHTRTASEIFSVALNEVSREQRAQAKAINFGLIYGKQAFSLAKELNISRKAAQQYIDAYFEKYPKVAEFMDHIIQDAKEKGYVTTLWGRRRYLPDINSRNRLLAQSAERMALNTPIQGTAADIIKLAMIHVFQRLKKENLDAELILQVHDELIIDANENIRDEVLMILKEEMENVAQFSVPLVVDAAYGNSWFDIK